MNRRLTPNQASALSSLTYIWHRREVVGYELRTLDALVRKGYAVKKKINGATYYRRAKLRTPSRGKRK